MIHPSIEEISEDAELLEDQAQEEQSECRRVAEEALRRSDSEGCGGERRINEVSLWRLAERSSRPKRKIPSLLNLEDEDPLELGEVARHRLMGERTLIATGIGGQRRQRSFGRGRPRERANERSDATRVVSHSLETSNLKSHDLIDVVNGVAGGVTTGEVLTRRPSSGDRSLREVMDLHVMWSRRRTFPSKE